MTRLERDNVIDQARYDVGKAAERARRIVNLLNRCEALAGVGGISTDVPLAVQLALEAAAILPKVTDCWERTTAYRLPIKVLIDKGKGALALPLIDKALASAEGLENSTSKADALFGIWQATAPLGPKMPGKVTAALCNACSSAGQKGQEHMRDIALALAEAQPKETETVLAAMQDGRYKRQAERRLAERKLKLP